MLNIQCFSQHIIQVGDLEKLCSPKISQNDFMLVNMRTSFLSLSEIVAKK